MDRERSRKDARRAAIVVAALSCAVVSCAAMTSRASAQIAEGGLAYVESDDGTLVLYRRIDAPDEGDGRARFVRVAIEPRGPSAVAIPIVPRSAVLAEVRTEAARVDVIEPVPPAVIAAGKSEGSDAPLDVEVEPVEPARFRLGVSALGGGMLGDLEGWLAGGSLRIGAQLGPWFAFYYQPTFLYASLGARPGGARDGGDRDGAFAFWSSFVGEVTLLDVMSIGVGPSIDVYEDCDAQLSSSRACAHVDEAFFGLHGRVALNLGNALFGRAGPGERGAISVSFEVHPTWFGDHYQAVAMLGGVGAELY